MLLRSPLIIFYWAARYEGKWKDDNPVACGAAKVLRRKEEKKMPAALGAKETGKNYNPVACDAAKSIKKRRREKDACGIGG
jgi:hypothetical protein